MLGSTLSFCCFFSAVLPQLTYAADAGTYFTYPPAHPDVVYNVLDTIEVSWITDWTGYLGVQLTASWSVPGIFQEFGTNITSPAGNYSVPLGALVGYAPDGWPIEVFFAISQNESVVNYQAINSSTFTVTSTQGAVTTWALSTTFTSSWIPLQTPFVTTLSSIGNALPAAVTGTSQAGTSTTALPLFTSAATALALDTSSSVWSSLTTYVLCLTMGPVAYLLLAYVQR